MTCCGFTLYINARHRDRTPTCTYLRLQVEDMTTVPNSVMPYGLLMRVWRAGSEQDPANPLHYRSPVDPDGLL